MKQKEETDPQEGEHMHKEVWLKKQKEYGLLEFMTEETLEETLALREEIRAGMENQRWFAKSGKRDFQDALEYGFALNCVVEGKVIASVHCLLEHTDYSRDIFTEEADICKCADYSDTFVHPDYRGNGLQNILEEEMEELCRKAGKSILLGTVDPDNEYSHKNFLKRGYQEVIRLIKYEGLERILMKKILN